LTGTPPSEALLDVLAPIIGIRRPDALTAVAVMTLDDVERLLDGAGIADDWPTLQLANALEEVRQRARRQTERDWSAGGRRARGIL